MIVRGGKKQGCDEAERRRTETGIHEQQVIGPCVKHLHGEIRLQQSEHGVYDASQTRSTAGGTTWRRCTLRSASEVLTCREDAPRTNAPSGMRRRCKIAAAQSGPNTSYCESA